MMVMFSSPLNHLTIHRNEELLIFNCDDDNCDGLPFYHGHAPGEGNPPKLTKLTLAFYLGQLLPEDWYDVDDGGQDDDDNDDDNDDDQEQAPDNVDYDDVSTL